MASLFLRSVVLARRFPSSMFALRRHSSTVMTQSLKEILRRFGHSGARFSEIPPEVRQKIHRLCADFVGGPWNRTRAEDLKIMHLRGGTSNMLFLCSLPASVKKIANGATYNAKGFSDPATPNEVLLRIYFNPNTAHHVVEESVVFTLLAERKLGPKLYGVFGDGRVEEYIHSRSLETPEIRMPVVSAKIARILAQIHQLTMPVEKTPTYLRDSMRKWMTQLRSLYKEKNSDSVVVARSPRLEKVLSLDQLEEEIELVIRCIEKSPSPIVFCHNDFQEGNILLKKSDPNLESADFGVIDYEYASYNYRAFDIANHFCEWTFDYHSRNEHPYFAWNQEFYPSEEQQHLFAKSYLDEIAQNRSYNDEFPGNAPVFVLSDGVETLTDEVKAFVPVSHFFWGVWAILLAETSPVQFGFTEYAQCRLELYYHLRGDLLNLLANKRMTNGEIHTEPISGPSVFQV